MKKLQFKKYIDWNVYGVTTIKNAYGFRVKLIFTDGTEDIQQKSGFETKKEANKARDNTVAELVAGTYVVYGKVIVADFMEHWLEEVMMDTSSGKGLTDSSYNSYRNAIFNYVIPKMGQMYMSTINREHIQNIYKWAAKKSESVAPLVKTVMNSSLTYAKSKNVVSENMAKDIKLPKSVKKTKVRVRVIDVKKTLNVEQIKLLLTVAKDTPIYMHILLAGLMGLRKGEIVGLKYDDIDFLRRKMTLKQQLGKKPKAKKEDYPDKMLTKQEIPLKTRSSYRELDIPDIVFEALLEERRIYEKNRRRRPNEFRDWDYVCCSTYGNPRSKSFHYKYYRQLFASLDLPYVTLHHLRSSFSTILMKNDFNLKSISNMLGHATEIISADVYGDTQEIIEDCLDVIEPFIEEVMPEEVDVDIYDYTDLDVMEAVCVEIFAEVA